VVNIVAEVVKLEIPHGRGEEREQSLADFASVILKLETQATIPMSSRGWCYFIEGFNLLAKGDFDKAQKAINECRKKGHLPIDFVAEHAMRVWKGVEKPEEVSPEAYLKQWLEGAVQAEEYYTPDWWVGESYYIQMMVEKIDLVNLFEPICREYHIPLVNAGGWYDIMERALAAQRFLKAEEKGLKPVILYFGDFDPFGLAISDFLQKNFWEIARGTGWMPDMLIVDRFGLNFDFIQEQNLTWIDNLQSGSGKDMTRMANRIVQDYVAQYGVRKCEANAVLRTTATPAAEKLCREAVEKYLGKDALSRFEERRQKVRDRLREFKERTGLDKSLDEALRLINEQLKNGEGEN
jgi:hypothetical protein